MTAKVYKNVTDEEILVQIDKWWKRLGIEKRITGGEAVQLQHLLFLLKQRMHDEGYWKSLIE